MNNKYDVTLEMKNIMNQICSEWSVLKDLNDKAINNIKKYGSADVLSTDQITKINQSITDHSTRLEQLETVANRPRSMAESTVHNAENKEALAAYIRKGIDIGGPSKYKSVDSNGNGYFTISTATNFSSSYNYVTLRSLARTVKIAGSALEMVDGETDAIAGWVAEQNAVEASAHTALKAQIIPVHELYAQPKASQKLLDDPLVDVEQWLSTKVYEILAAKENMAFISGSGDGQPRGILSYQTGSVHEHIRPDKALKPDDIMNLLYGLPEMYQSNAKLIVGRELAQYLRLLKEQTTGRYMWQPSLSLGTPSTIMGVEVIINGDMPDMISGNAIAIYGDIHRAYTIVEQGSIRIIRDQYTEKPYVKFFCTKRIGGDITNCNAFNVLKLS